MITIEVFRMRVGRYGQKLFDNVKETHLALAMLNSLFLAPGQRSHAGNVHRYFHHMLIVLK
jgi:hypothetical protein